MSVLDRVKLFLPVMEQANKDLEAKIARDGKESVQIDKDLLAKEPSTQNKIVVLDDSHHSENSIIDKDSVEDCVEDDENSTQAAPMVKIEFALGDFDSTPIANIEMNNEDSENLEE